MKIDRAKCLSWILVECISTRRGHGSDDERGLELDSEDVEVLEIMMV